MPRAWLAVSLTVLFGCARAPATTADPPAPTDETTVATACASRPTPASVPTVTTPLAAAAPVAQRFVDRHRPERTPWRWDHAIAVFGLARLVEAAPASADRAAWQAWLRAYYRAHPEPRVKRPDDCAPALGATVLSAMDDGSGAEPAQRVAEYIHSAPRNRLGTLDHLDPRTTLGRLYPASIWVDSLVMVGLTSALLGQQLDDPELLALAHAQPQIFAEHLQDPRTGLFRHAYLHERRRTRPRRAVFWLRGNGWVALALVELLATMEPTQPEYAPTQAALHRLVDALRSHRSPQGMWTTVIDAPRTYEETSGSALVAVALAKGSRLGLLDGRARAEAQQTFETLTSRLRPRRRGPALPGTSGPTIPSRKAGYAVVPRSKDVPYGVGAYLLLAAELSRSP